MPTAIEQPLAVIQRAAVRATKSHNNIIELKLPDPHIGQFVRHDKQAKKSEKAAENLKSGLRTIGTAALEAYNEANRDNAQTVKIVSSFADDEAAVLIMVKTQYTINAELVKQAELELPKETFEQLFVKQTVTKLRGDAVAMLQEMVKKAFGEAALEACMETVVSYSQTPKFEEVTKTLEASTQKLVRNAAKRFDPTIKSVDAD